MIRNENEYREAVTRLQEEKAHISRQKEELVGLGLSGDDLKRAVDPLLSFHLQLKEEVESYERLKRGEIAELTNLRGLGHRLICARIAKGMSQSELATRLGVDPSQVCRDERNEYHGITIDRAAKVLEALGARIHMQLEIEDACEAVA
jgi:ribosome-binding protein aMBF1 (putative translation factor)